VATTPKPAPSRQRRRFGRNLAKLRKEKGLTQGQLAEKVDLDPRYIQGMEYGDYWPSLPVLGRLKRVLRSEWEDLLRQCDAE
jgi:transcriptional regulator with XRE-family HTH domain